MKINYLYFMLMGIFVSLLLINCSPNETNSNLTETQLSSEQFELLKVFNEIKGDGAID